MMKMQLNIILKYSIMNVLTVRERIYLSARERHNIEPAGRLRTLERSAKP